MHPEPTSAQPSTAGPERHHDDEARAANDVEPSEPSDHGDATADADEAGDDEPISRGDGLWLDACGTSMVPAGPSTGGGAVNGNGAPHVVPVTLRQGTASDSDLANAERLVALYGPDLRHVEALGGWHTWAGSRWCCDRATVAELAKETTRRLLTDAEFAMNHAAKRVKRAHDDDEVAKAKAQHKEATALFNWAKRSQSARGIDAMLRLAETEPIVRAEPGDFDADPWLLNCRNGVLDLRTGELRDHDRRDMMRRIVPVAFDPDAELPVWDRFLADVTGNDEELIGFLRRAAGYTLTGDVRHEVLFFVHGPPASGKSTFLEALKITMGEYAAKADFETFIARRDSGGPRNDIARLAGARLVLSIEVDEGKRLAEGLVKQLTGGDTVTARFLYRESFEFKPAFKLWLAANDAPRVRDDDAAIWRRILRIPFEHTVPKEKRDPQVKAALLDPAVGGPAILA
ncbi:phage-related protein [Sorangium cellulosum So ce56]|uniref:Phage-related protein n=1 Tax=Sorangium cellulosum (strain So ce56) TaxID=448385 RepID=A9EVH9_SORC5|nr:phage/plasmid primase, P4 family [Sorangium cellulosum]CAN94225.1 phage-related protein [Sorangium cellulosum So ce56]